MKAKNMLDIREGKVFLKENNDYTEVPLKEIRIVSFILPEGVDLFLVFYSSGSTAYVNIDLLDDEQALKGYTMFINMWDEISKSSKKPLSDKNKLYALNAFKLYVMDYQGNSLVWSLRKLKETNNMDVLTNLKKSRLQRINQLKQWLDANPTIDLKKGKLHFNKQGYQIKKRKVIPWEEVSTIQIEEVNFATHFYVLPEGVSGGYFSFRKASYFVNIKKADTHIYAAESFFWKALSEQNYLAGKG
jgi:hypothetical protein